MSLHNSPEFASKSAPESPGATGSTAAVDPLAQAQILEGIARIRAGRGYVLPSHAILAAGAPDLLDRYEDVFRIITYTFSALTPFEKNFVWLVVIACAQTPTGAAHLKDFVDCAGTVRQVEAASALGMLAVGGASLGVIAPSWQRALPEFSPSNAYLDSVARIVAGSGLEAGLIEMALAAGQACLGAWDKVTLHIRAAKHAGVSDNALAEALTVMILPAGNPAFVQASSIWRELIRNGEVEASPAYRYAVDAI